MEKTKIAVIGAGPAGIGVGVEMKRAGRIPAVLLEKAAYPCKTIAQLIQDGTQVYSPYRQTAEHPRPALTFSTERKEDFLARMSRVVDHYGLDIRFRHECNEVVVNNGTFRIFTSRGLELAADLVVVAIGIFGLPRLPSYPIPQEVRDKVYFGLPGEPLAGKNLLVVGCGDPALEAACILAERNRVTFVSKRPSFFRVPRFKVGLYDECCRQGMVNVRLPSAINLLEPEGDQVKVWFSGGKPVCFDGIVYFLGGSTPRAFLENIGVRFEGKRPQVDEFGETNIPRLFLAGDLALERGSIVSAFQTAARVKERIFSRYRNLFEN